MSSPRRALVGRQTPRLEHYPLYRTSAGDDAIDLAAVAGIDLDEYQQYVLRNGLGEGDGGRWLAYEVLVLAPRQNGKNVILEARELAGLFLFGDRLQIHTAHEFKTAEEAFLNMQNRLRKCELIEHVFGYEGDPEAPWIRGFRTSHGSESIQLKNGARLRYATRTSGAGRGFSSDLLIIDEAFALTNAQHGAIMPTMSARSLYGNPQIWYTSSAGMPSSDTLARLRARGLAEDDDAFAFFEWSVDEDADPADPENWAIANPALGIRISQSAVESELRSQDRDQFLRERLGVWVDEDEDPPVITPADWSKCLDVDSTPGDRVVFAVDIPPSRESAVIVSASQLDTGLIHVEVVDQEYGVSWLAPRLEELLATYPGSRLILDAGGATGALQPDLARYRVRPQLVGGRDYGQACGQFFDLVNEHRIRHIGQVQLDEAVSAARIQPMGESLWKWKRKNAINDISPLVATSLAVLGVQRNAPTVRERRQRVVRVF